MLGTGFVFLILVLTLWGYSKWRHTYWARKGIPSPPTHPFLGHFIKLFTSKRWMFNDETYQSFGKNPMFGLYEGFNPVLVLCHPDLFKTVFVKDFDSFTNRRPRGGGQEGSLMSLMLGNAKGKNWRALRSAMSPAFSSGKLRRMYPTVERISDIMVDSCIKEALKNPSINIKEKFGRYVMDTAAACGFGIECNSLTKEKPMFALQAESLFSMPGMRKLFYFVMFCFPQFFNFLGLKVDVKEINFFRDMVIETINERQHVEQRDYVDFIEVLMEARTESSDSKNSEENHVLNDRSIVAQSVMFLITGYDTTSSCISFTCHLLAKYPDAQDILRNEIQDVVMRDGKLTYEGVMECKYLDACVMESLRMYPPIMFIERECTKNYKIPGTKVELKPGDAVQCLVWSIHHDPQYWPNPEEFQPERFLPENKANIKTGAHIPFGTGPRICIALRFALMEIKTCLAKLVLAADLRIQPGHEIIEPQKSPLLLRPQDNLSVYVYPRKSD